MRIKVDNYYINTDSQGNVWITEEVMSKKTGNMKEVRVSGYKSNFRDALTSMFSKKVFKSEATNLHDAIDYIQNMFDDCEKVLRGAIDSGMQ